MKAKSIRNSFAAVFLGLAAGYSLQASALPLEPFGFEQHSGFIVDTGWLVSNDSVAGNKYNDISWYNSNLSPAPVGGTFDTIAWGTPSTNNAGELAVDPFTVGGGIYDRYSGLRVIGHAGTLTTGVDLGNFISDWGSWQAISTVYHANNTISAEAKVLAGAVIYSQLLITHNPEGLVAGSPNAIPITFNETLNALNINGQCTFGNPNGSICDDLFGFPSVGFASVWFQLDGHSYEIEFGLGNFQNSVTDFPVCNNGPECTVWTAEGVISSMDVLARIREVPEPGSLALAGLGLVGLAALRRRKQQA